MNKLEQEEIENFIKEAEELVKQIDELNLLVTKVSRHEGESIDDCVSRGIATLINEGKDPEQAAAIAYSMCGEKSGCTCKR